MIWHLDWNGSLILLASYGDQEIPIGKSFPGSVWRNGSKTRLAILHATSRNPMTWFEENTEVVINLYGQGLLIGFLLLDFAEPINNPKSFAAHAKKISWPLSLYLALRFHESLGLGDKVPMPNGARQTETVNEKIEFTTRQVSVLSGITAKKTNHEIAIELGYSVSTIRHETMGIFRLLGVSDRVAAAVEGRRLGLA